MKCQSCGAEIKDNSNFCEYCGTKISAEMRHEREEVNKVGCPNCGSSKVSFTREKTGEVEHRGNLSISHATVGLCNDCGHTWRVETIEEDAAPNPVEENKKKNRIVWWILGWIFCWPVPLMVLIWRKKCTWSLPVKIIVTIAIWAVIFGISGNS